MSTQPSANSDGDRPERPVYEEISLDEAALRIARASGLPLADVTRRIEAVRRSTKELLKSFGKKSAADTQGLG